MEGGETVRGFPRGDAVLSTDGRFFFQDRQQVDARDLQHKLNTFPGVIVGATADLAVTKAEICDIETAAVLQPGDTRRAQLVSASSATKLLSTTATRRNWWFMKFVPEMSENASRMD